MTLVTLEYVRLMARYNQWLNTGLRKLLATMSPKELAHDHGAFFGTIHAIVNHLLWGDILWMSRFDGGKGPPPAPGSTPLGIMESVGFNDTIIEWEAIRIQTDGRIHAWAEGIGSSDLNGDIEWYSGAVQKQMRKLFGLCVVQLFNHQTHHRGQILAMLTATARTPNDTDVPFMPEDI